MAYINTIKQADSEGDLKNIYDDLIEKRGKIADVHMIQSLNPQSIVDHMSLYMTIMYGKSPLKRVVREIIGTVVSRANKCEYCVEHHAEAVNHYWKDENRTNLLKSDYRKAGLNELELILAQFAENVTLNPGLPGDNSAIERLKKAGLDDRAILDATLIIAYFNFVNRIVLTLGVQLEPEGSTGYKF